jgi:hypothetical protein
MSKEIPILSHRLVNNLQIVVGAMELGAFDTAILATQEIEQLIASIVVEIRTVALQRAHELQLMNMADSKRQIQGGLADKLLHVNTAKQIALTLKQQKVRRELTEAQRKERVA